MGVAMLILGRQQGQAICVGPNIKVTLLSASGGAARIGIDAPKSVTINREEIQQECESWERVFGGDELDRFLAGIPQL